MRASHSFFCLLIMFISCLPLSPTEVDSFTDRDPLLRDATREINRMINSYFVIAVQTANKANSCEAEVIQEALIDQIKRSFWSVPENTILENILIDKRQSRFDDSIYRDFTLFESPALHIAELGPIMKLGNWYIGSDKIGHFLQTGYELFKLHYIKAQRFQDVNNWSEWTERTYFGASTTGVYSYGDLAANYDGLSFWERVSNVDLHTFQKSYFTCFQGRWWHTSSFDISDYSSAAWDEGVNCNGYKTVEMEKKVDKQIAEVARKTGRPMQCPMEQNQCRIMIEQYGNMAQHLITPRCF